MIPHPYADDENIRLLDDAFIKICNMVNDSSMNVRAEAVGLLGSLHDVSFPVLEQTLDKKLMSKGKVAQWIVFCNVFLFIIQRCNRGCLFHWVSNF